MSRSARFAVFTLALAGAGAMVLRASDVNNYDADLQYQIATVLFEESRYGEAMEAYLRAAKSTSDPALVLRSKKGRVRSALRIAEFGVAREEADTLRSQAPRDPEALTLHGDSLWAAGLFDESDA